MFDLFIFLVIRMLIVILTARHIAVVCFVQYKINCFPFSYVYTIIGVTPSK